MIKSRPSLALMCGRSSALRRNSRGVRNRQLSFYRVITNYTKLANYYKPMAHKEKSSSTDVQRIDRKLKCLRRKLIACYSKAEHSVLCTCSITRRINESASCRLNTTNAATVTTRLSTKHVRLLHTSIPFAADMQY